MVKRIIQPERSLDRVWLRHTSSLSIEELYDELGTSRSGLTTEQALASIGEHGPNTVALAERDPLWLRLVKSFADPFVGILILVAAVSIATDVVLAAPGSRDGATPTIIAVMVLISGLLRFIQESKSGDAAAALAETIETTCTVERADAGRREIGLDEVAVGDIVHLSAGDIIPADLRIVAARDLFVGQSALTGEAAPVEKRPFANDDGKVALTELENLAFLGTTTVSGTGVGVVVATGRNTLFGAVSRTSTADGRETAYSQGIDEVSRLLLRLMLIMVPTVFILNGLTKGDWLQSLLFAFSIAVGLTPEMLPMIVTTCLAKGAVDLGRERVVVKKLDAIQNLGSMDVLCTDKTGTLTQDSIVLERHLDVHGNEDVRVLAYAFLNSFFETGLRNLIDSAIIARAHEESAGIGAGIDIDALVAENYLIDELPFDFERRRVSVVVGNVSGETRMITKGAIEEVLSLCDRVEYAGTVVELDDALEKEVLARAAEFSDKSMRVLGVCVKKNPASIEALTVADECGMVLIGYLAFLDPPKESSGAAVRALADHGVETKVLTGDSARVATYICRAIGIEVKGALEGSEVEMMDDAELAKRVGTTTLFSKLSPDQKARVVSLLRTNGHIVGYMGDGVNDAPAMVASDCGISVDSAVDIAKESADIILLEKDLMVLERGIEGGRRTFANMSKYVRITASSNFGNIFSVLVASAFLPFLPMTAVQLLLLNLMNDLICTSIPWDNVDDGLLLAPRSWSTSDISRFMRLTGPVSSIFDIASFAVLFFVICPAACGGIWSELADPALRLQFVAIFQAGWFVESMLTQILALLVLRREIVAERANPPALPLMALSIAGALLALVLVFTPVGAVVDFAIPPLAWLGWLAAIMVGYGLVANLAKKLYLRGS
ncbi:magnesium-translocating P-type ATPase [Coriobacteriales bacterium OH1046]|nr:magnesium-translocating P-type ATPase [Coriobacteriales bacterium OH1046]